MSTAEPDVGLSVEDLTDEVARRYGYEDYMGVVVTDVQSGSPAAAAGITPGMLIMEVNRDAIRNTREFDEAITEAKKGGRALLLVKRQDYSSYLMLDLKED